MVLVGVQPSLMQVPPTCSRSIKAVFQVACASAVESGVPACPEPMMMALYFSGVLMGALAIRFRIARQVTGLNQARPDLLELRSQNPGHSTPGPDPPEHDTQRMRRQSPQWFRRRDLKAQNCR